MSKPKSLTKNFIYNLLYQILILIIPLVSTPYISRVLGAENIGIYSFTLSIATYFVLFGTLGTSTYGQREIAYVAHDKEKYSKTFWEIFILKLGTMTFSLLTFFLFFVLGNSEYNIYYAILTIEIVGSLLDISWLFQGLEEFKKTVLRNAIIRLVGFALLFVLVKTPADLPIYFAIHVASTFFGNFSLWFYLPKFLSKVNFKSLNPLKHLKNTIVLFIPQVAIQVYTVLDKTMIGAIITDKSEVGYYEQSQKLVKVLLAVVTSLGIVMASRIAKYYAAGKKRETEKAMYKSFRVVFLMGMPIMAGLMVTAPTFSPLFYGEGYDAIPLLLRIISPILIFIGMSNVIGIQYLLPTKKQTEYTASVISGAAVNFIANLILIPKLGAVGASIGTVIAEFTTTAAQLYFVRKDFQISKIIFSSFIYIFASIIMVAVCLLIGNFVTVPFYKLIAQVVVGALSYGLVLVIFRDPLILEFISKVKSKLHRC
ncbi:MAG: flippase [Candidatus Saccharibacteria bacterium]|nr:flippase [Candidatus Saccharibacteria bacterium]